MYENKFLSDKENVNDLASGGSPLRPAGIFSTTLNFVLVFAFGGSGLF